MPFYPVPVLRHINIQFKEKCGEIAFILQKLENTIHLNSNARKLLEYYMKKQEGFHPSAKNVRTETGISRYEDSRKELAILGLICYNKYDTITVDWERIYLFANYLQEERCARDWRNVQTQPVKPKYCHSVLKMVREIDGLYNFPDDSCLPGIETIGNEELEQFLDLYLSYCSNDRNADFV